MVERICIIGAGMAGCVAAKELKTAGFDVFIVEKSGGVGGRMSTRRTATGSYDHGTQYITARGEEFSAMLNDLSTQQSCAQWRPAGQSTGRPWYIGKPGMSALVKPLIKDIPVYNRHTINSIALSGNVITIGTVEGNTHKSDRVIVTCPAPQTKALVGPLDPTFNRLDSVAYAPCWALMMRFADHQPTIADVTRRDDTDCLAWVARETTKRHDTQANGDRFTVHAGGAWSAKHLEEDRAEITVKMLAKFRDRFAISDTPVHCEVHRWRYARVDHAVGQPFLAGANDRLLVAGDGMLGGKVEAAFDSGLAAARHLTSLY